MNEYDENYEQLTEAIQEAIARLDPRSDSYQKDVATLAQLYSLKNDAEKNVIDANRIEYDRQAKIEEDTRAKKRNWIDIASIIAKLGVAVGSGIIGIFEFSQMMDFETDGGFFKGFAGKLFSKQRRKEQEMDL